MKWTRRLVQIHISRGGLQYFMGGGVNGIFYNPPPPMEFYTGNLCQNQQAGVYNLFLKIQIKGRNVSPFLKPPVHIIDYYSLFIPVYYMVELAYCYVQTDYK